MLTVLSWYQARKGRKTLQQLVEQALGATPTVLAIVADQYTAETSLRPFHPLAERFGDRLHFILAAEWPQPDRERDGEVLLRSLGLSAEHRPLLLRDAGDGRAALVLRQKKPIALIDLFFLEKGGPLSGEPDRDELEVRAQESAIAAQLEELLYRLPPQPPPPPRTLLPGEHDFSPAGVCRACRDGRASLRQCPGPTVEEGPRRDRFELIELD